MEDGRIVQVARIRRRRRTLKHSTPSARFSEKWWDEDTLRKGFSHRDEDLALLGTTTETSEVAIQRDRLEKAHLKRILDLRPDSRVLDLGGGSGRIALWLAPEVTEVTVADVSGEALSVLDKAARRRGLRNVVPRHCSALDYEPG